jgi:hypothetical protein
LLWRAPATKGGHTRTQSCCSGRLFARTAKRIRIGGVQRTKADKMETRGQWPDAQVMSFLPLSCAAGWEAALRRHRRWLRTLAGGRSRGDHLQRAEVGTGGQFALWPGQKTAYFLGKTTQAVRRVCLALCVLPPVVGRPPRCIRWSTLEAVPVAEGSRRRLPWSLYASARRGGDSGTRNFGNRFQKSAAEARSAKGADTRIRRRAAGLSAGRGSGLAQVVPDLGGGTQTKEFRLHAGQVPGIVSR